MASNGHQDPTIPALGHYWDAVVRGEADDPGDLVPTFVATVRHLHAHDDAQPSAAFTARLTADLEELMASMPRGYSSLSSSHLHGLPTSSAEPHPMPPGMPPPATRRAGGFQGWHKPLTYLATAALVLLTLVTAYVAFGPPRGDPDRGQPASLPALLALATPAPDGIGRETLIDTTVAALPSGHAVVAVERVQLQPGPTPWIMPGGTDGTRLIMLESGALDATLGATSAPLVLGTPVAVTSDDVTLQVSGSETATVLAVYLIGAFVDANSESSDLLRHMTEFLIETSADALPGGTARVTVERLTIPPGGALPAETAAPWTWTEVGSGTLGLTLDGEQLPFRWDPGDERTFQNGRYLPVIRPGTRMVFRNAGDVPLILDRLTLTPEDTGATAAAPLTGGTPTP